MEKLLKLPTLDNYIIYGTLNSYDFKSSKLIIFVHGLTGNQYEHQFFNAAPFFTKRGFDTFRFDLYSDGDNARQLSECSIKIHAKDLTTVIDYFKDSYEELFLVGHSLGAPTILYADINPISKIVLWDPARGMRPNENWGFYNEELDMYILKWGTEILVNQEMYTSWLEISNLELMVSKINKSCKFIFAGNNPLTFKSWQPYLNSIKVSHDSVIIKGAAHLFVEEGVEEKLFEETLKWLV